VSRWFKKVFQESIIQRAIRIVISDKHIEGENSDAGAEKSDNSCHMSEAELNSFISPPLTVENMDRYLIRASILNAIKEFLSQCNGTLLDVGCGKMPYKSLILGLEPRVRYIGLDIENSIYQQDVKPDFFWDGTKIPFDDCSIDCAMATELFEHLPEPDKVMKEIIRVLKPNGLLFITVPFLWPLHDVPHDEYRYTPFALERHLKNCGFDVISLKPLGGWNASLAQMIGLWTRRKPMPEEERARVSREIFPFYRKLIESDEKPEQFCEGQMITGLYGTAVKPGLNLCSIDQIGNKQSIVINEFDNTSLKVCYIVLHIPVPSETFVINEIIALQTHAVGVYTVSLWPSQKCHDELMARIKNPVFNLSDEAVQQRVPGNAFYSESCSLAASYDISPELAAQAALAAEYVLTWGIDHIHAHFATEAALVALLVSELTGITFSFTAHAYDVFRLNVAGETYPERRLKLLVEHAAKIITISEYNRKHFLAVTDQACADKLEIVHYGMDLGRFNKLERKAADRVTFLSVGRLVEKKGHEYLLRAFKKVLEICDVQLRIVGEGDLRPALKALADELGIADKVTFIGAVSSNIVLNEMLHADVFVLHSITGNDGDKEGMPVSIMEACVTGLPVVSTRHAGIPELIIEGVSGFLVEERDCDGFAEAMRTLALSPELREKMGMAGHAVVSENFNILHEAQKLKDIFTGIIEKSRTQLTEVAQGPFNMPENISGIKALKRSAINIYNRLFHVI